MSRIRLNPDHLSSQEANISSIAAQTIQYTDQAMKAANSAPSYDGQFGPKVRAIAATAFSQATQRQTSLDHFKNDLSGRKQRFVEADSMNDGFGLVKGIQTYSDAEMKRKSFDDFIMYLNEKAYEFFYGTLRWFFPNLLPELNKKPSKEEEEEKKAAQKELIIKKETIKKAFTFYVGIAKHNFIWWKQKLSREQKEIDELIKKIRYLDSSIYSVIESLMRQGKYKEVIGYVNGLLADKKESNQINNLLNDFKNVFFNFQKSKERTPKFKETYYLVINKFSNIASSTVGADFASTLNADDIEPLIIDWENEGFPELKTLSNEDFEYWYPLHDDYNIMEDPYIQLSHWEINHYTEHI